MYSEKHKICMTISQGRKKKHLYKETKEMGRCTRYIYMFVLIWAFRKCHIKLKQNVLVFQCKAFCACM